MFAVLAFIVFIIGLILTLIGVGGFTWICAFLGLAFLAVHFIWSWTPWARRG